MNVHANNIAPDGGTAPQGSDLIAPDARGQNFYDIDPSLRQLLQHYLPADVLAHMQPHFHRLGEISGGRLDELSELAEKHPPRLHYRDRFGRDADWIEFHPAYREMEKIAFADFNIHAATHKPVLGWHAPLPYLAKYALQYLFVQAEFALMCPISVTDTSAHLVKRYASDEVKARYLDRMLSLDMGELLKSAQFMTEKAGGSDISNSALTARLGDDGKWRLYGDKWFCSCADGDVALLLARPENAPAGSRGLALFLLPRQLEDGSRNAYRIVRLKDKLGTKSMASGEIVFEGAEAHLLGDPERGLRQMLDQVNLSRLSHGVRAAAMMRRCLNEALAVARNRNAFGRRLIEHPLLRRQLMKIMVPTEQALSMAAYTAHVMERAEGGDEHAASQLRILTPLLKYRTARDNIHVATGAMEVRGGNGYIEDWINARLVRDAHLGVLWEGTSNINALDVVTRAVAKARAHEALADGLRTTLDEAEGLPGQMKGELNGLISRVVALADAVAADPAKEPLARKASAALYNVTTAALLAAEGAAARMRGEDDRRLLLARMVIAHRLGGAGDPLSSDLPDWESAAVEALLQSA